MIDRFYSLTPQAEADILEIWDYIADDSEDRADEVVLSVTCDLSASISK